MAGCWNNTKWSDAPNPDWLAGREDAVIYVGAAEIRIHTPDKSLPPGSPTAQLLTGEGAAGLGQGAGRLAVDDDGNLYCCSEIVAEEFSTEEHSVTK